MRDKSELTKAINLIMRESVTKKFKNRKEWIRDVKKQLGEFDNLYYRAKILEKFDNKKSAIEIINQMRKLSKIEEKYTTLCALLCTKGMCAVLIICIPSKLETIL